MYEFEENLWKRGFKYIVGVDEVGRGPLAGPVVAAAVILNPNNPIEGLNDSKQLSAKKRQILLKEIQNKAIAYAYCFIDEAIIDKINIYQASKKAMLEAISKLTVKPEFILSDAMPLKEASIPFEAIIKGDTLSASIAAASIVAKETRDAFMIEMDQVYPGYGFKNNKGYPTKEHINALEALGICKIHRKTYKPVKQIIEKQLSLWE
ncbi:MAG: ribonuclease HII [Sphaerochaetaceae bacterium]|nr:ribonuclease HII [Sphaerochaetaceae bacterium]